MIQICLSLLMHMCASVYIYICILKCVYIHVCVSVYEHSLALIRTYKQIFSKTIYYRWNSSSWHLEPLCPLHLTVYRSGQASNYNRFRRVPHVSNSSFSFSSSLSFLACSFQVYNSWFLVSKLRTPFARFIPPQIMSVFWPRPTYWTQINIVWLCLICNDMGRLQSGKEVTFRKTREGWKLHVRVYMW